ncbi:hypothetical protein E4T56_gene11267 [Termitomyces sp. T112]|nr:hypothetical protein E4T56_gene11267 [Termitomyces sp. T112]
MVSGILPLTKKNQKLGHGRNQQLPSTIVPLFPSFPPHAPEIFTSLKLLHMGHACHALVLQPGRSLGDTPSTMYTSVNPSKPSPMEAPEYVVYPYSPLRTILFAAVKFIYNYQVYVHFVLRLHMFYWSRIARIFKEAEMTMPEIALQVTGPVTIQHFELMNPAGANFKITWEHRFSADRMEDPQYRLCVAAFSHFDSPRC